jgi:hypothetical protein
VVEAWLAWRWWDKGQLGTRYPAGVPLMLCRAVEELDDGYHAGLAHRMRTQPKGGGSE